MYSNHVGTAREHSANLYEKKWNANSVCFALSVGWMLLTSNLSAFNSKR